MGGVGARRVRENADVTHGARKKTSTDSSYAAAGAMNAVKATTATQNAVERISLSVMCGVLGGGWGGGGWCSWGSAGTG